MGYLQADTIDWQDIVAIDAWLDEGVAKLYRSQPLAQDWARLSKVAEELGEAVQAFIGVTGQNPRKGVCNSMDEVLDEMADVVFTGILCMQHFTKDPQKVRDILRAKLAKTATRVPQKVDSDQKWDALAGVRPPDGDHGLHP